MGIHFHIILLLGDQFLIHVLTIPDHKTLLARPVLIWGVKNQSADLRHPSWVLHRST